MKKMTLSILAGLMIIGSAFAVPGPEDRKALCDKHPDKYVWVKKTQACIPINPCDYGVSDEIAKAYCLDKVFISLPENSSKRNMILERYAEKVLKTEIMEMKLLGRGLDDYAKFVAIKTSDGGYFVAGYTDSFPVSKNEEPFEGAARAYARTYACSTYGVSCKFGDKGLVGKVNNKTDCEDIADFASLLLDDLVEYEFKSDTKECVLK